MLFQLLVMKHGQHGFATYKGIVSQFGLSCYGQTGEGNCLLKEVHKVMVCHNMVKDNTQWPEHIYLQNHWQQHSRSREQDIEQDTRTATGSSQNNQSDTNSGLALGIGLSYSRKYNTIQYNLNTFDIQITYIHTENVLWYEPAGPTE